MRTKVKVTFYRVDAGGVPVDLGNLPVSVHTGEVGSQEELRQALAARPQSWAQVGASFNSARLGGSDPNGNVALDTAACKAAGIL